MPLSEVNNNQTELHRYSVLNKYICFLGVALFVLQMEDVEKMPVDDELCIELRN